MRALGPLGAFLAGAALVLAAPASPQTTTRPCAASDLAGSRTPAVIETDDSVGTAATTLAAQGRYRVTIVPEEAINNSPDRPTGLRDGSVTVSSPSGIAFTSRSDTASGRQVFAFEAPATDQTLQIVMTYTVDIGEPATDACTASATFSLPVRVPQTVTTTAKFVALTTPNHQQTAGYYLTLKLPRAQGLTEKLARDQHPISVRIRLRKGTTIAPRPSGPATYSVTYRYQSDAQFLEPPKSEPGFVARYASNINWNQTGISLACNANAPRSGVRYGFSVQVSQSGKTVGGMHGGGTCRSQRYLRNDGQRRTRPRITGANFSAKP